MSGFIGTPVQETSGSDQSQVAGSQDQDHVTGSASSTQSSPSSENESAQGTSNSAQSGSPGTPGLGGDIAGSSRAGNVGPRGGTQAGSSGIRNSQVLFIVKKLYGSRPRKCHNKIMQPFPSTQRKRNL